MFTGKKIAQMAAFFADRQGGAIDTLKLVKLLYLSDREAVDLHSAPISFDRMVSMPHGPVLSTALNLVHGDVNGATADDWSDWISDCRNHQVELRKPAERHELDELSNQDLAVLDRVWSRFGHMSKWEIRDWTHEHLPEWRDPKGSSFPIGDRDLLQALGRTEADSERIAEDWREQRELSGFLASL